MQMAAIGFCCVDVYQDPPHSYPTGNGIDCILNLSKKGVQCSAVTAVGTDTYGRKMLQVLKQYSINTENIRVMEGNTSVYKMALLNGNDRVHLENMPGVMADYYPTKAELDFAAQHAYIHTDLAGKTLDNLDCLKTQGGKLVFDFSICKDEDTLRSILPFVNYAFFSCGEESVESAQSFLKTVSSAGSAIVVATLGERGSICYDGIRFYTCGITKVPVVNTVGAGDAYIAGFVFGLMHGLSVPQCMQSGSSFAADVVQRFEPY